jgi:nucleotide-binding universal stress UspA family protein
MMDGGPMTKIVVGVDGSVSSQEALRWAAAEAKIHGLPLEALLAWGFLDQRHVPAEARYLDPDYDDAHARTALAHYVSDALGSDAAAGVELRPTCDLPARALVEAGQDAALLVVGARGRGGFASLLLGSVSQKVLHRATCPVAVIRVGQEANDARRGGRIVVGVDGSRNADAALRWALAEGRRRGAGVEVVHGWHLPFVPPYPHAAPDFDATTFEDDAREALDQAIRRAHPTPEDRLTKVMSMSGPSALLLETAKGADLIVVGSRGLSATTSAVLGSVSHQVTLHATCPVVVVPEEST